MFNMSELLLAMLSNKASDMHIVSGASPSYRIEGHIYPIEGEPLTASLTKELCYSVLTDMQRAQFEEKKQLDCSFSLQNKARFRANIFFSKGAVSGAFRYIPYEIPELSTLGLPDKLIELLKKPRGLILITGGTGSGKSTSLASMVNYINQSEPLHIVTIEDPIEYIHPHRHSIVNQREIGRDAHSFGEALKAALREDPDVILVGELRDRETIETALQLAETGHLVLSTLHTNSTYQSITRMIQVFPSQMQDHVRTQLSMVLEGILTQALLPRVDEPGRVLAYEFMLPTPSIRNLIRENKLYQIQSAMQLGQDQTSMITMNQYLVYLTQNGIINFDLAMSYATDTEDLIKSFSDQLRKKTS